MLHAVLRWVFPILAMFAFGPLALLLISSIHAPDGSRDISVLLSAAPAKAMLITLAVAMIALVVGATTAHFTGHRRGIFCAGLVLAWAAFGNGEIDRILARVNSAKPLITLAIEGLMLALGALALCWAITKIPVRASAPPASAPPQPHHPHAHHPLQATEPSAIVDSRTPLALLAAMVVAAIAVWIIAQDVHKGQVIAATVLAGMGAAMAGRMVGTNVSPAVFVFGVALLAAVSPAAATMIHPSSTGPVQAALAGGLFPLARPLPFHYLAGALIGVPLGLSWAGSLIEKHDKPA